MIDYDKLKLACILSDNAYSQLGLIDYDCANIDELIAQLYELNKNETIKPKYEIGKKIWSIVRLHEPKEFTIANIHLQSKPLLYKLVSDYHESFCEIEDLIYPSREALIQAQIEHWQGLK